MDPGSLFRELRGGHTQAVRLGLFGLGLGAVIVLMVVFLLTPVSDGLIGLPGHDIQAPSKPRVAPVEHFTPAQRMGMRRTAVRVATREVGVRERPGRDNVGRRITTYRRAVTGTGEIPWKAEPWCADFVSWVWRRAGAPIGFDKRGSDYVPQLVAWARLSRRWHWARDGYRPRPGDLIVFKSDGSMRGHIGMVVRVTPGRVHTVEGNYKNRVSGRTIKPWDGNVTGFIAPV